MYTPTQLEIIKIFWKKDFTEWCLVWEFDNQNAFGYKIISYEKFDCPVEWDSEFIRLISFHRKKELYQYDSREWNSNKIIKFLKYNVLWHIPTLEDIFIVAHDREYYCEIVQSRNEYDVYYLIIHTKWEEESIEYNPTIPVLEQSEYTLKQLISLFK